MQRLLVLVLLLAMSAMAQSRVIAVDVDGVVHPITVEILTRAIRQAAAEHADLLLIRLNTPGGLLDATRQCIQEIVSSPVPVVTFVTPSGGRAASAGFFLLQAGDIAAMTVGTHTGAASPILLGREMDPVVRKKAESDAAASLRSLASRWGRNAELAEKAVFESKSFTDTEALQLKVVDLVVRDEKQLLSQLNGREIVRFDGTRQTLRLNSPSIVEYEPSVRERVISSISDPNLAFILLIVGVLGLYVEFSSPGLILPGVVGGILVLLGLSAISALPIHWAGAALLLLALTLFALEAKFVSHGILAAGGTLSMIMGALFLIEGPPEVRIRLGTAIAVALPFAFITALLVSLVVRARAYKVVSGASGMLNEVGVARTDLTPDGKVYVHGEYWDALCTAQVSAGTPVRVIEMDGLRLKVVPCPEE